MTRTIRGLFLGITIAVNLAFLIAFYANRGLAADPFRPAELDGLAPYLADHPADWLAASAIADQSLDSTIPRRFELWRTAYAHATSLAPRRPNGAAAFARAGLFHWYELGAPDRAAVLRVTAPLLREPRVFSAMHRPLWQLTGDLAYLRKNAPDDERALNALSVLAATNGRFTDYRELRDALTRKRLQTFEAERATRTIPDLLGLLPIRLTKADEPLVRGILDELERRPIASEKPTLPRGRVNDLLGFAKRHDIDTRALEPLLGADLTLPRTQVAGEWSGICGKNEVCNLATATLDGPINLDIANVQSDEVPPYVEIYVDDALVHEGAIEDTKRFTVADRGMHRVEVRLVNPLTRNRFQRRVRLS